MSQLQEDRSFSDYLDSLPDVVLVIHPQTLKLVEVNRSGGRVFDYEREDLLALHLPALLPRHSKVELIAIMKHVLAGDPPASFETTCRYGDGEDVAVDMRFAREPISSFVVASVRDIRARVAVEEQLRQLNL